MRGIEPRSANTSKASLVHMLVNCIPSWWVRQFGDSLSSCLSRKLFRKTEQFTSFRGWQSDPLPKLSRGRPAVLLIRQLRRLHCRLQLLRLSLNGLRIHYMRKACRIHVETDHPHNSKTNQKPSRKGPPKSFTQAVFSPVSSDKATYSQ